MAAGPMNTALMFSTGKDDWQTPPELFDELNAEFNFAVDVAANETNHQCPLWFGPGGLAPDALALKDWRVDEAPRAYWCNPPYSRGLQKRFIEKAAIEQTHGVTTVMLLPARTDTQVFHREIWNRFEHRPRTNREVRFLKGRLKFVGAKDAAPFPSMIVVFRG